MSGVADTQRFDALYKTLSACVSKLDQLPPEAIDEALALAEQGQAAYTQAKARLEAATQRLDAMFAQRDPA
jgi:exonuclease VII small subunit